MANLPNETITAVFELQRLLLQIIDQAAELEFMILEQFGETETTIAELDEIQNVKERAASYYTRLYRLLLQLAQSQPVADSATLDLLTRSLNQTQAIESCRTSKPCRNKKKLEFIMNNQSKISDNNTRERSIAKMREISMMFDAQIMVLDELIAKVESQNRQNPINNYRQKRGQRLLASLQQEREN